MTQAPRLHDELRSLVDKWRVDGYPSPVHPALTEILSWQYDDEGQSRYLRTPQIEALEVYWYLREVEQTPGSVDLYRRIFDRPSELRRSLGLDSSEAATIVEDEGIDALLERVRTDDDFVKRYRLEALRETLDIAYPSYIFALAMGAGKTALIGAIVATEFAMAMEYPDDNYIANALVFAPGKTIIESLRELYSVPYERILPPRFHKMVSTSLKITFTRDGEQDIAVTRGSLYNLIVTNTEKIRIQKEAIRKSDLRGLVTLRFSDEEGARSEIANRRLQTVASLPHLGVFSDEAHHTYGQSLQSGLKKVRKTVDYLAENTNVICVVNTTGTPYYKKKMLPDVVNWYGLSAGIADGILKDVAENIITYEVDNLDDFVRFVITDFFNSYGDVVLPSGALAKLAIYFPQNDDIHKVRPVVDDALVAAGLDPSVCLVNTSDTSLTSEADIVAFNRLNDPASPHRLVLLVNKGTEGWNCPSLFSTALARRLKNANNFVLQAATRCLRQVPGNTEHARIYLSHENYSILDSQLQETYGEGIERLNKERGNRRSARLVLRKRTIPPIEVEEEVTVVVRDGTASAGPLTLTRPDEKERRTATKRVYTTAAQVSTARVLAQVGSAIILELDDLGLDHYTVATDLAVNYRLEVLEVLDLIRSAYGDDPVPLSDLDDLASQIETQKLKLTSRTVRVKKSLALVKETGFTRDVDSEGKEIFYTEVRYPEEREHLLLSLTDFMKTGRSSDFGFHYDPYKFDSRPEKNFFEQVVKLAEVYPDQVEDIYFTGALTDPAKTGFFIDYKDGNGRWRRYTPDFVIRTKALKGVDPKVVIVEIKAEAERGDPIHGETGSKAEAVRRWEATNPERIKYHLLFTSTDTVAANHVEDLAQEWRDA